MEVDKAISMRLKPDEQRMLDGSEGMPRKKAMELLVKYAEALGADDWNKTVAEVAALAVFLVLERASYVNGVLVDLDTFTPLGEEFL